MVFHSSFLITKENNHLMKPNGNAQIDNFLVNIMLFLVCRIYIVFQMEYCYQLCRMLWKYLRQTPHVISLFSKELIT